MEFNALSSVNGEISTMNLIARWLYCGALSIVIVVANSDTLVARPAASAGSSKSAACAAPEYHQFDFWVGDWDAFDIDNPTAPVARTRVDRILDGCVLREDYQGRDGHQGQSFSIYDASRKVWHQSWVTNRGELLVIEG